MKTRIDTEKWYPIEDCAEMLDVNKETVARHFRERPGDKKLKGKKRGLKGKWHAKGSDLIVFMRRHNFDV